MISGMVLAGGGGRRLGGVDKALVEIGGTTLLDRALGALEACDERIVVGPARPGVDARFVVEPDPGGGPAPAVVAGAAAATQPDIVVVLAVDLPLVTAEHVELLVAALGPGVDAAAALDHRGKANPLLAAYRAEILPRRADAGLPAAALLPPATATVDLGEAGLLNVNTPEDLERARTIT